MPRTALDERDRALLVAPNFCHVATLRPDGSPRVVPVWVDVDGDRVLLNGADSRRWTHEVMEQGRATLTVQNLEDPYEYVSIRGAPGRARDRRRRGPHRPPGPEVPRARRLPRPP